MVLRLLRVDSTSYVGWCDNFEPSDKWERYQSTPSMPKTFSAKMRQIELEIGLRHPWSMERGRIFRCGIWRHFFSFGQKTLIWFEGGRVVRRIIREVGSSHFSIFSTRDSRATSNFRDSRTSHFARKKTAKNVEAAENAFAGRKLGQSELHWQSK